MQPILSYIIVTKNKLPFFRKALYHLIDNCKIDEEIIIIDGASNDGTVDFLKVLKKNGLISNFISEPDLSEGHAFNKGMLLAKGIFIKVMTDDDVFDFKIIEKCKTFMMNNNSIHFINSLITAYDMKNDKLIPHQSDSDAFLRWYNENKKPYSVCGLGLMIRKNSLSLLGLLKVDTKLPDLEYSLRISSLPVNAAWCTGIIAIQLLNTCSISRTISTDIWQYETKKFINFYNWTVSKEEWRYANNTFLFKVKSFKEKLSKLIRLSIQKDFAGIKKRIFRSKTNKIPKIENEQFTTEVFDKMAKKIKELNTITECKIYYKINDQKFEVDYSKIRNE